MVEAVEADSPAAAAGVKAGDMLEQIDDVTVVTSIDLERSLLDRPAGAKITVKVTRDKASKDLELVLEPSKTVPLTPGGTDVEEARAAGSCRSRPMRSRRPTRSSTAG